MAPREDDVRLGRDPHGLKLGPAFVPFPHLRQLGVDLGLHRRLDLDRVEMFAAAAVAGPDLSEVRSAAAAAVADGATPSIAV